MTFGSRLSKGENTLRSWYLLSSCPGW